MDTIQAILKINPNAKVNVIKKSEDEDEVITWLDGTAEISQADIEAKKSEFAYVEVREKAYLVELGGWDKQLEMIFDDFDGWKAKVQAIKDANPKED
tara:strand:- start:58 stop:348 length:291 start_codon:yes stop_codon:yes gene_type:complete